MPPEPVSLEPTPTPDLAPPTAAVELSATPAVPPPLPPPLVELAPTPRVPRDIAEDIEMPTPTAKVTCPSMFAWRWCPMRDHIRELNNPPPRTARRVVDQVLTSADYPHVDIKDVDVEDFYGALEAGERTDHQWLIDMVLATRRAKAYLTAAEKAYTALVGESLGKGRLRVGGSLYWVAGSRKRSIMAPDRLTDFLGDRFAEAMAITASSRPKLGVLKQIAKEREMDWKTVDDTFFKYEEGKSKRLNIMPVSKAAKKFQDMEQDEVRE